jgi:glycosyltransferase involved in cell wall biosynthesis
LIIGPTINKNPLSIGGTTVFMCNVLSYFNREKLPYLLIKTNRFILRRIPYMRIVNYIYVLSLLLYNIKKTDVVFINVSNGGIIYLYPIIAFISSKYKKDVFLRMFGGSFKQSWEIMSKHARKQFFRAALRTKIIFAQTKFQVQYLRDILGNKTIVEWFPNVRTPVVVKEKKKFYKKFVFISQIKQTKGIDEILKVSNQLSDEYTIDIYGPINDNKYNDDYFKNYKVNYLGVLHSIDIIDTLNKYDILLFPTYHYGEGYPGIIIEAFSLGIPVITTKWMSIPEMVFNMVNGILIEPQNVTELKNAILLLNDKIYLEMAKNALNSFNQNFNADILYSKIVNYLYN